MLVIYTDSNIGHFVKITKSCCLFLCIHFVAFFLAYLFSSLICIGFGNSALGNSDLDGHSLSGDLSSLSISGINPADVKWASGYANPNIEGKVYAIAVQGTNVFIGGDFTMAGGLSITNIAKWNGKNWASVGNGISSPVYCLYLTPTELYVGGHFGIKKLDGDVWVTFGNGIFGIVYSIIRHGEDLVVGGHFDSVRNEDEVQVVVNNVVRWDGESWHALGEGVNLPVFSMASDGQFLYIGGEFGKTNNDILPGTPVNHVAKWDGNSWSPLTEEALGADGVDGYVYSLVLKNGKLYVGGVFESACFGQKEIKNIAIWDGSTWSQLGTGLNDAVEVILPVSAGFYCGGDFTASGTGVSLNHVALWDGFNWKALSGGSDQAVHALAMQGATLFVGGEFRKVGNLTVKSIAQWAGTKWKLLGKSFDGRTVEAYAVSGKTLYVGGEFTSISGVAATNVVKMVNGKWSALGPGLAHTEPTAFTVKVSALAVDGTDLYAGGTFLIAGDLPVNRIAKWNGQSWSALGNGLGGQVSAITVSGKDVFVGGSFTNEVNSMELKRIARWDGSNWHPLGTGSNQSIRAITKFGTNIVVGGNVTLIDDVSVNRIARWDGASWHPLGEGFSGTVIALCVAGDKLYAGGSFSKSGTEFMYGMAVWDGISWKRVGGGFNSIVNSLYYKRGVLYATGGFTGQFEGASPEDPPLNRIAKWNGKKWLPLGSGLNAGLGHAIAILPVPNSTDLDIFVGGTFTEAGNKPSYHFARWRE